MTSATTTGSPSLYAATTFLTRPLSLDAKFKAGVTLTTLQLFLHSTLLTAAGHSNNALTLFLSPTENPPLPIHLACAASGIQWSEWIRVLGGTAFSLVVEPSKVSIVRQDTGSVGIVWAAHQPTQPASESDDAESISRPSSRSSNVSTFSFSSSVSSTSSTSSSGSSMAISPAKVAPIVHAPARTTETSRTAKYVYQGGISTVLTGGVMLGGGSPKPALPAQSVVSAPKNRYVPPHLRVTNDAGTGAASWRRGVRARTS